MASMRQLKKRKQAILAHTESSRAPAKAGNEPILAENTLQAKIIALQAENTHLKKKVEDFELNLIRLLATSEESWKKELGKITDHQEKQSGVALASLEPMQNQLKLQEGATSKLRDAVSSLELWKAEQPAILSKDQVRDIFRDHIASAITALERAHLRPLQEKVDNDQNLVQSLSAFKDAIKKQDFPGGLERLTGLWQAEEQSRKTLKTDVENLAKAVGQAPSVQVDLAEIATRVKETDAKASERLKALGDRVLVLETATSVTSTVPGTTTIKDLTRRLDQHSTNITKLTEAQKQTAESVAKARVDMSRIKVQSEGLEALAKKAIVGGTSLNELSEEDKTLVQKHEVLTVMVESHKADAAAPTPTCAVAPSIPTNMDVTQHEQLQQEINLLREDIGKIDDDLEATREDVHKQSNNIRTLQKTGPNLFKETVEPVLQAFQTGIDSIRSRLDCHDEHIARLGSLVTESNKPNRTNKTSEAMATLQLEVKAIAASQASMTSQRDRDYTEIQNMVAAKANTTDSEKQINSIKQAIRAFESRYSNITTDHLYERMVRWIMDQYPSKNAPALVTMDRVVRDVAKVKEQFAATEGVVTELRALSPQLAWLKAESAGLAKLLVDLPTLQKSINHYAEASTAAHTRLDDLKQDMTLVQTTTDQQCREIREFGTNVTSLQSGHAQLQEDHKQLQVENAKLKRDSADGQKLAERHTKEIHDITKKINHLDSDHAQFKLDHEQLQVDYTKLKQDTTNTQRMADQQDKDIREVLTNMTSLQSGYTELKKDHTQLQGDHTILEGYHADLSANQSTFAELQVVDQLGEDLKVLKTDLSTKIEKEGRERLEAIKQDLEKARDEVKAKCDVSATESHATLKTLRASLDVLHKDHATLYNDFIEPNKDFLPLLGNTVVDMGKVQAFVESQIHASPDVEGIEWCLDLASLPDVKPEQPMNDGLHESTIHAMSSTLQPTTASKLALQSASQSIPRKANRKIPVSLDSIFQSSNSESVLPFQQTPRQGHQSAPKKGPAPTPTKGSQSAFKNGLLQTPKQGPQPTKGSAHAKAHRTGSQLSSRDGSSQPSVNGGDGHNTQASHRKKKKKNRRPNGQL